MRTKAYQAYTLRNYKKMPQYDRLSAKDIESIEVVGRVLPFKSNNYVVNELIDWDNLADDPIFTLNFPRKAMLRPKQYQQIKELLFQSSDEMKLRQAIHALRYSMNPNPSGQEHNVPVFQGNKLDGMQHKYRETVLLFPRQGQTCHAYCTFCFRWPQFSELEHKKFRMETDMRPYLDYLKANPAVTDVLFTGGDPMTMKTNILQYYIDCFLTEEMSQIQSIRIGTKALSYWPYRFLTDADSGDLLRLFEKIVQSGKNLAIMAHFNHPVEFSTPAVQEAIRKLRNTGAQIRVQSPVLQHINDHSDLWAQLWREAVNRNCIPYYMFVARETGAKHFFELSLERCWEIFQGAYQKVSGLCRTVRGPSMSTIAGKIQILGVSEIQGEKIFILRFIQGRNPDWVARPFFAKYNPKATWISELEPAFDESKFFFEKEMSNFFTA